MITTGQQPVARKESRKASGLGKKYPMSQGSSHTVQGNGSSTRITPLLARPVVPLQANVVTIRAKVIVEVLE